MNKKKLIEKTIPRYEAKPLPPLNLSHKGNMCPINIAKADNRKYFSLIKKVNCIAE